MYLLFGATLELIGIFHSTVWSVCVLSIINPNSCGIKAAANLCLLFYENVLCLGAHKMQLLASDQTVYNDKL